MNADRKERLAELGAERLANALLELAVRDDAGENAGRCPVLV
ncbi:MAG: hypothetical protein U1D97_13715 [Desulfuromonadales bacterium]|nr:hypothetical protein [Desulfuromonadales bacterium]